MRSLARIKRGWGKFGVDFDDLVTDCSGGKTIFDRTTSVCTETCAQFPIIGECFDGVGECGGVCQRLGAGGLNQALGDPTHAHTHAHTPTLG